MQRKKLDSITIIEHRPFINVWKFLHSRLFFFVLTLNVRIIKYCLMHHNNTNFIAFCVPCATDCRCKRYFKQTKNYNLPAFRKGLALLDRHNTLNAAFYYSDDCSLQFFFVYAMNVLQYRLLYEFRYEFQYECVLVMLRILYRRCMLALLIL